MPKVFVSDAIEAERLAFSAARQPVGGTWKTLSALYQASLAACGHTVQPIIRPEIYQTAAARRVIGVAAGDWHLAVKPTEQLRPFHGIANVFVCNWPFAELSHGSQGVSPFFDQVRLLGRADAVICCTEFTAQTLRRAGIARAMTLPPHVPAGGSARRGGGSGRQLWVTTAGLSLAQTIEGFMQARAVRRELALVVAGAPRGELASVLGGTFPEDAVSFSESGVVDLLPTADGFVASGPAEALDPALIAAMRAGVPLVSAVGGFLITDCLLPIAGERREVNAGEPLASYLPLTVVQSTVASVRDGVLAAAGLDPAARARMTRRAAEIAEQHFGLPAFATGLARLAEMLPA
jgi:hypothetical protein